MSKQPVRRIIKIAAIPETPDTIAVLYVLCNDGKLFRAVDTGAEKFIWVELGIDEVIFDKDTE